MPFEEVRTRAERGGSGIVVQSSRKEDVKNAKNKTFMAFRSGLYRTIRIGKTKSDMDTNRQSIQYLIEYVEGNSVDRKTGVEVAKRIKETDFYKAWKSGGEYVDKAKLLTFYKLATDFEIQVIKEQNERQVELFLGHDGLLRAVNAMESPAYSEKSKKFPKTFEYMRKHFKKATAGLTGKEDPSVIKDKATRILAQKLKEEAAKASKNGEILTEKKIMGVAQQFLNDNFDEFVRAANYETLSNFTKDQKQIANAVSNWARVVSDKDRAVYDKSGKLLYRLDDDDAAWLADQLRGRIEHSIKMPERQKRGMGRAADLIKQPFKENSGPLVGFLLDDIAQSVRDEYLPLFEEGAVEKLEQEGTNVSTEFLREHMKKLKIRRSEINPEEDLPRLFTDKIKPILVEHRKKELELNPEKAEFHRKLGEFENKQLATLPEIADLTKDRDAFEKFKLVGSDRVSKFVEMLTLDYIGKEIQNREHKKNDVDLELGSNDEVFASLADINVKITEAQEKWAERLQTTLRYLDDYANFQLKKEEILKSGGLANHPNEWKTLEGEAETLSQAAANISKLSEDLAADIQDDGKLEFLDKVTTALSKSARRIQEDTAPLLGLFDKMAPYHAERRLDHLPLIRELHLQQADEKRAARPDGTQSQAAEPDDTPSRVVKTALAPFTKDASEDEVDVIGNWSMYSASFLDEYADFAVRSENLSRLQRLPRDQLSDEQRNALEKFDADRQKLLVKLEEFAGKTKALTEAMTGKPNFSDLSKRLETTVVQMRNNIRSGHFIDTDRGNPVSTVEDGVSRLTTERFGHHYRLVHNFADEDQKSEIQKIAEKVVGAFNFIEYQRNFKEYQAVVYPGHFEKFDKDLSEMVRSVPVPRSDKLLKLGALDALADQVKAEAIGLRELLDQLDRSQGNLEEADPKDISFPKSSATEHMDDEEQKRYYLKRFATARKEIQQQIARIESRLADYDAYRGKVLTHAPRQAYALNQAMKALNKKQAPVGGFYNTLEDPFWPIVGEQVRTKGISVDNTKFLSSGLRALDNLYAFRQEADPVLASGNVSASRMEDLRKQFERLRKEQENLDRLVRLSASVSESILKGGEGSTERERLNATNWEQFDKFVHEAHDSFAAAIKEYDAKLNQRAEAQ